MKKDVAMKRTATLLVGLLAFSGLTIAASSAAVTPISFNKASDFAITTTGGFVNSGSSIVEGNLGLVQTISYTDTGLLTLKGDYHFGDAAAVSANTDVVAAYAAAVAETPTVAIASELGGVTLTPGIYSSATGFTLNGILTLNAQNDPNAIWVFQTPLTIATGAASKVNLINGGQPCNVNWQVGTTSTLGAGTDFKGNLLGKGNFQSATGTSITGRVLINGGNVSLATTNITVPKCKKVEIEKKNLANGGGSYRTAAGRNTFNLQVSGIANNGTFTDISGHLVWNVDRAWKFNGDVTTYSVDATGIATVTGTGPLYYYSKIYKGKDGRWANSATANVIFTAKFARDLRSDGTLGKIKSFAIGFTGTPVTGVPQLPVLGALTPLTSGGN